MATKIERVKFGTKLNPVLINMLKELSDETDIPQNRLIERALKLLFTQYGKEYDNKLKH